jgi:menaquinone-9 beta-reductase
MRYQDPLIIGGGPAGSSAAIMLARGGAKPLILERQSVTGDALCGGFMSWHTLKSLARLGVDPGGHPIDRVRVFAGNHSAEARLPAGAIGLSRHRLDTILLAQAQAEGAGVEIVNVRNTDEIDADSLFLATGKHDLRGLARPKLETGDSTLGLRVKIGPHPRLTALIGSGIELHLFDRGYVGLLLQEDGRANLCLAVRKSRLAEAGGKPEALLRQLGDSIPALGERLAFLDTLPEADAIASVPYGWRATATTPGIFRLGDQAAVIPSIAGEGNGIAIASGIAASAAWTNGGAAAAPAYQVDFARRTRRPVSVAKWLWERGETPWSAALATRALTLTPFIAKSFARATRIGD